MSTKQDQNVRNKKQDRKDRQDPASEVRIATRTSRTRKPTAIPEPPVAVIVSSDAPTETAKATTKTPKRPATTATPPQPEDGQEVVVFAVRMLRCERDLLHRATGSAKASKFVRAIVLAGARGDMKAIQEIVDEAQASRQ